MSHYATPFKINVDVSNRAVLGRIRAGRAYILLEQDCPCSPPLDVMTNATDDPADDQNSTETEATRIHLNRYIQQSVLRQRLTKHIH